MTERNLTCIGCPLGCQLTATLKGDAVTAVSGHTCRRGEEYARKECTAPERSFTGTVRVSGGTAPVVAVRTARPIPKAQILPLARYLAGVELKAPVLPGDTVLRDVLGTGTDLIATAQA